MGVYNLKTGPSYKLKTGPSFFSLFLPPIFIVLMAMFINTNSVNLCQNSVFAKCRDVKNEVFEKKLAFFVFVVSMLETEKQKKKTKWKKAKKNYKNSVLKVVIQTLEK